MKKIFAVNVGGCVERWLDLNRIRSYLSKNNYILVDTPKEADIIILVTCAALNEVVSSTLDVIKNFQKYDAKLIIGGCLPDIEAEELSRIFNGDTIATKEIDQKIESLFPPINNIRYCEVEDSNSVLRDIPKIESTNFFKKNFEKSSDTKNIRLRIRNHILRNMFGEHSITYKYHTERNYLYHIRISWGCIGNCSFCITKKAIGSFKSKPFEECIQEFKRGLKAGYRDFIICSDDPGAYGLDIKNSFPNLLNEMTNIEGNYNLMITGLSPVMLMNYVDEMEEILKKKKITAILFPIQSGSSRILKLMNRYSDVEKMKDAFLRLKKAFPDLILETQIILGFPTETLEDFKQSLNFVKECNFYSGYLYKFSCRPGTDAEKIEPKVSDEEMSKRLKYAKNFFRKEGYKMSYFKYGLSGLSKDMNIFHLK